MEAEDSSDAGQAKYLARREAGAIRYVSHEEAGRRLSLPSPPDSRQRLAR